MAACVARLICSCARETAIRVCRRLVMVESVKWVDEVVPRVPYDVSEEFMQRELFQA